MIEVRHLFCTKCQQWKPDCLFPDLDNSNSQCGKGSWCKKCVSEYNSFKRQEKRDRKLTVSLEDMFPNLDP